MIWRMLAVVLSDTIWIVPVHTVAAAILLKLPLRVTAHIRAMIAVRGSTQS